MADFRPTCKHQITEPHKGGMRCVDCWDMIIDPPVVERRATYDGIIGPPEGGVAE
jgi:hypothetical protein